MTIVRNLRDEKGSLAAVREWLRTEARHSPVESDNRRGQRFFDMSLTCSDTYECGTIACIGGYAWLHENPGDFEGANLYVFQFDEGEPRHDEPLGHLFYPRDIRVGCAAITPAHAIMAIDHYLANGVTPWREIMAKPPAEDGR